MPRVAARAAVAPRNRGVAAQHLFDGDVMFCSAFRAQVRDATVLDLSRRQVVQGLTRRHEIQQ
jgi:hypothetical protein